MRYDQTIDFEGESEEYVIFSDRHRLAIYTGVFVNNYIKTYESYSLAASLKGTCGNRCMARGRAFVVSNEGLNLEKLVHGVKRGMFL